MSRVQFVKRLIVPSVSYFAHAPRAPVKAVTLRVPQPICLLEPQFSA